MILYTHNVPFVHEYTWVGGHSYRIHSFLLLLFPKYSIWVNTFDNVLPPVKVEVKWTTTGTEVINYWDNNLKTPSVVE